ncbi:MAG: UPF0280 family protein [Rhodobacteraceae bacterium]|nr:UPF0280 family protein [Paracoccaceae bacterium]
MTGPVAARLPGDRLHLQHGPIDLVIDATGDRAAAFAAAWARFRTVLPELVAELPALRAPAGRRALDGPVARRMLRAVLPHAARGFITPMAAVAGAVADEILLAMRAAAPLARAYVNNGGDIALHLAPGQAFRAAIATLAGGDAGRIALDAAAGIGGIATSGTGGRSFTLGIADQVTVLAADAAAADAAATVIANAVDLPGHPAVTRVPASSLQPDSDLGDRPVTAGVGPLAAHEVARALDAGAEVAGDLARRGLIRAACLMLRGEVRLTRWPQPAGALAHA